MRKIIVIICMVLLINIGIAPSVSLAMQSNEEKQATNAVTKSEAAAGTNESRKLPVLNSSPTKQNAGLESSQPSSPPPREGVPPLRKSGKEIQQSTAPVENSQNKNEIVASQKKDEIQKNETNPGQTNPPAAPVASEQVTFLTTFDTYDAPSFDSNIASTNDAQTVKVIKHDEVDKNWIYIETSKGSKWAYYNPTPEKLSIPTEFNTYKEPKLSSKMLGTRSAGTVTVLAKKKDNPSWLLIELNKERVWAYYDPNSKSINMTYSFYGYDDKQFSAKQSDPYPAQTVKVVSQSGDWYLVEIGKDRKWIYYTGAPKEVNILTSYDVYNTPDLGGWMSPSDKVGTYKAQTVTAYAKYNENWLLVQTDKGLKWAYCNLNPEKISIPIAIDLYEYQSLSAKKIGNLPAQTVTVIARGLFDNNWMLIETDQGRKWTYYDPNVKPITMTYSFYVYDDNQFSAKQSGPYPAQTVKVVGQSGDWYLVEIGKDRKWIYYTGAPKEVNIPTSYDVYNTPDLGGWMSPSDKVGTYNAQTVTAYAKYNENWLLVQIDKGRKWAYYNLNPEKISIPITIDLYEYQSLDSKKTGNLPAQTVTVIARGLFDKNWMLIETNQGRKWTYYDPEQKSEKINIPITIDLYEDQSFSSKTTRNLPAQTVTVIARGNLDKNWMLIETDQGRKWTYYNPDLKSINMTYSFYGYDSNDLFSKQTGPYTARTTKVIQKKDNWYLVEVDKDQKWIYYSGAPEQVKIPTSYDVYNTPSMTTTTWGGLDSPKVGTYKAQTVTAYAKYNENWLLVQTDKGLKWAYYNLKPEKISIPITIDLYEYQSFSAKESGNLPAQTVTVIARDDSDKNWMLIETNQGRKWTYYNSDLKSINMTYSFYGYDSNNLFSTPSSTYTARAVNVVRQIGDWYLVEIDKDRKWIYYSGAPEQVKIPTSYDVYNTPSMTTFFGADSQIVGTYKAQTVTAYAKYNENWLLVQTDKGLKWAYYNLNPEKISIPFAIDLYEYHSFSAKKAGNLPAQTVAVIARADFDKNWMLIETNQGRKWTYYDPKLNSAKINIPFAIDLYEDSSFSAKKCGNLPAQTVTVIARDDSDKNWMLIETNQGRKWTYYDPNIKPITMTYSFYAYDDNQFSAKQSGPYPAQTVKVIGQIGDWYLVEIGKDRKWIYYTGAPKEVNIPTSYDVYNTPDFGGWIMSPSNKVGTYNAQTVIAYAKYNENWLLVQTDKGLKWAYCNLNPEKISIPIPIDIYENQSFNAKKTGNLPAQTVTVIARGYFDSKWMLIETNQGRKWTYYDPNVKPITMTYSFYVYDDNQFSAKQSGPYPAQTVKVVCQSGNWYLVEIDKSRKWVYYSGVSEQVKIPTSYDVYDTPSLITWWGEDSPKVGTYNAQTVTAYAKYDENWLLVQTDKGLKWAYCNLKPEKISIPITIDLYENQSFSAKKAGNLPAQTVTVIARGYFDSNWMLIETNQGRKWTYYDPNLKSEKINIPIPIDLYEDPFFSVEKPGNLPAQTVNVIARGNPDKNWMLIETDQGRKWTYYNPNLKPINMTYSFYGYDSNNLFSTPSGPYTARTVKAVGQIGDWYLVEIDKDRKWIYYSGTPEQVKIPTSYDVYNTPSMTTFWGEDSPKVGTYNAQTVTAYAKYGENWLLVQTDKGVKWAYYNLKPEKISIPFAIDLYEDHYFSAKKAGNLPAQTVTMIARADFDKNWMLIETNQGRKWTYYDPELNSVKINIPIPIDLYEDQSFNAKKSGNLPAQTVTVIARGTLDKNWMLIETNQGRKWTYYDPNVKPITMTYSFYVYDDEEFSAKQSGPYPAQTVKAIGKFGDWYLVDIDKSRKWIYYTGAPKEVKIPTSYDVYNTPDLGHQIMESSSNKVGTYNAQTVTAYASYGSNWLLVQTDKGLKWAYYNPEPKKVYIPFTFPVYEEDNFGSKVVQKFAAQTVTVIAQAPYDKNWLLIETSLGRYWTYYDPKLAPISIGYTFDTYDNPNIFSNKSGAYGAKTVKPVAKYGENWFQIETDKGLKWVFYSGNTYKMAINSSFDTYDKPALGGFGGKKTDTFAPQTVTVYAKYEENWFLISTYKGAQWAYYVPNPEKITIPINLTLYNDSFFGSGVVGEIAPQTVNVLGRDVLGENWMLIDSYAGRKWIYYNPKLQTIKMSYTFYVYDDPSFYTKPSGSYAAQTVTPIANLGENWYQINTAQGKKWIYFTGEPKQETFTTSFDVYDSPELWKKSVDTYAPQTVTVYIKESNWYLIKTDKGNKWAYYNATPEKVAIPIYFEVYKEAIYYEAVQRFAPQSVTVIARDALDENWMLIETSLGRYWTYYNPKLGSLSIPYTFPVYDGPGFESKKAGTYAPQMVKPVMKMGDYWYRIETSQGLKWVYYNPNPEKLYIPVDFDTYDEESMSSRKAGHYSAQTVNVYANLGLWKLIDTDQGHKWVHYYQPGEVPQWIIDLDETFSNWDQDWAGWDQDWKEFGQFWEDWDQYWKKRNQDWDKNWANWRRNFNRTAAKMDRSLGAFSKSIANLNMGIFTGNLPQDFADKLNSAIRNMEDPFAEEPAVKYEYSNLSNKNIDLSAFGIPKSVSEKWLANQAASMIIEFVPIVGNIKIGFDMKYGYNTITKDKYDGLDYTLGTVSIILGGEVKVVSKVITKTSEIKGMSKVLEHEGAVVKGGSKASWKSADLLDELASSGVKYSPDDVLAVTKTADGKLVWLENGNSKAGMQHILDHADDFARKGIPQNKIQDLVMKSLTNGKIVGYQGKGTGRPIYEVMFEGQTYHTAITTGNNGFIVGANPTTWP